MNTADLKRGRAYFEQVHGVTMRAVRSLADEELDFRPSEGMRSPKELVYHMYAIERELAEAIRTGRLADDADQLYDPEKEKAVAELARIRSCSDLVRFAESCHESADRSLSTVGDEQLTGAVESPYGEFDGAQFVSFLEGEHWHHRGQLFVYLRLLGKAPPGLYAYDG